jgi:dienelactone hydrolase
MGLGDMEKYRAEQMAAFGYKAFALDVYGKGIRPSNPKEAGGNSSALEADPAELHKRVNKGLSMLETEVNESVPVNKSALVANGYCFGGVMVLELARTGAPVVGVSSFHGELGNLTSQGNDQIKAAVQVHHADLDFQNASVLLAFENEMRNKKVATWATTKYGNCYHGWTDPTSSNYNAQAAIQSHASMRHFYAALLGLDYAC